VSWAREAWLRQETVDVNGWLRSAQLHEPVYHAHSLHLMPPITVATFAELTPHEEGQHCRARMCIQPDVCCPFADDMTYKAGSSCMSATASGQRASSVYLD
jgi:hypothetical protein